MRRSDRNEAERSRAGCDSPRNRERIGVEENSTEGNRKTTYCLKAALRYSDLIVSERRVGSADREGGMSRQSTRWGKSDRRATRHEAGKGTGWTRRLRWETEGRGCGWSEWKTSSTSRGWQRDERKDVARRGGYRICLART